MSKSKAIYVCKNCGFVTPNWEGKCRQCEGWNTLEEKELIGHNKTQRSNSATYNTLSPNKVSQINNHPIHKISSGIDELDRALSGGFVKGQVVLLAGDPGVGKSTLLLQLASTIKSKVLYVSAEETEAQVALRSTRLGLISDNLFIVNSSDVDQVVSVTGYDILIIDSIQMFADFGLDNIVGSSTQVRVVCNKLVEYAKSTATICILVGHITKDGLIAGPKTLEHMVDTVLYLEGDKKHSLRLLRVNKNRFGSDSETGIFEMTEKGLIGVKDLSGFYKSDISLNMPGSTMSIVIEGTRPVAVEIQALVNKTAFGYPKRAVSGFSLSRLNVLCAVMQKRAGINLLDQDVYVNVVSGFSAKEPAVDLAVCASILSNYFDRSLKPESVFIGEVGLSGEILSVPNIERRIKEAKSLGYKNIFSINSIKKIDELKKCLI